MPLFIEELTKAVLETSADPDDAALPLAVPGTLQASLMARLDRLPAAKQVAQIGAVIGREFPHALLAAAASLPEAQLARGLDELIASGLVLATRRTARRRLYVQPRSHARRRLRQPAQEPPADLPPAHRDRAGGI